VVDEEIPRVRRLRKKVPIDAVINACDSFYRKNRGGVVEGVKRNEGRLVAIYLAKVLSGGKGKEIGHYFGIKGPAVSESIKNIEGRLDKESPLKSRVEFLKSKIFSDF
jgi:chromosomal replication initiation ATPase DnaA